MNIEAGNLPIMHGNYCIRKMDLFALTTTKVAENLTKEAADKLQQKMQTLSIDETGCHVPIFFITKQ